MKIANKLEKPLIPPVSSPRARNPVMQTTPDSYQASSDCSSKAEEYNWTNSNDDKFQSRDNIGEGSNDAKNSNGSDEIDIVKPGESLDTNKDLNEQKNTNKNGDDTDVQTDADSNEGIEDTMHDPPTDGQERGAVQSQQNNAQPGSFSNELKAAFGRDSNPEGILVQICSLLF